MCKLKFILQFFGHILGLKINLIAPLLSIKGVGALGSGRPAIRDWPDNYFGLPRGKNSTASEFYCRKFVSLVGNFSNFGQLNEFSYDSKLLLCIKN